MAEKDKGEGLVSLKLYDVTDTSLSTSATLLP